VDLSLFSEMKTGEIVPLTGPAGLRNAFVPDLVPPKWQWNIGLWPLLNQARIAVASLDSIGRYLPDPALVLRPLQNREAQCSSMLAGIITDPQQQALFQIDPKSPRSKTDPLNAYREVFNYNRALRLLEKRDKLPLSLRLIRQLHDVLMDQVREDEQDPGNFRRTQNRIGRPARYVPPPVNYLHALLDNFEKYLHQESPFDPLVNAFIAHYQFEAIHPFRDGNGRVGRLLLSILISEWCNLSNQSLYMSDYFDRNRDKYFDTLLKVSTEGKWEDWVGFCLEGTIQQAHDMQKRCDELVELSREFRGAVENAKGSLRISSIIDGLFESPVVTISNISRKYDVVYNTAKSYVEKLAASGVLEELGGLKTKTFYCRKIFDITYKDVT
jgi:Fic family protein